MKAFVFFLLTILTITNNIVAQEPIIKKTIDLILNTYNNPESNRIHAEESKRIDTIFKNLLKDRFKLENLKDSIKPTEIFSLIENNCQSIYEDSPDIRRILLRRSICFSSLALLCNEPDIGCYSTYFEYAKISICNNSISKPVTGLETNYLGLLLLELIINYQMNDIGADDLKKMENFTNNSKVNEEFLQHFKDLIVEWKNLIDN